MPNPALDDAIKEAYASAPSGVTVLHTLQIDHPAVTSMRTKLDLCFAFDTTGSMAARLADVKSLIDGLVATLLETFAEVRFSLIVFKNTTVSTVFKTGDTFVDFTTFNTQLQALTASGGNYAPENGYGAIVAAAETLDWRYSYDVGRALVLLTDEVSTEVGSTLAIATSELVVRDIIFCYQGLNEGYNGYDIAVPPFTGDWTRTGGGTFVPSAPGMGEFSYNRYEWDDYNSIAVATGGVTIPEGMGTEFTTGIVDAIHRTQIDLAQTLYIIQDRQERTLTLEGDLGTKLFSPVGFRFNLPTINNSGLQELTISIDNVDRVMSDFLEKIKGYNSPVVITYRPYLSNDPSKPQMDPPLVLYLRDVVVNAYEISGRATFADIVNKKFPNEIYSRLRFPSLGD